MTLCTLSAMLCSSRDIIFNTPSTFALQGKWAQGNGILSSHAMIATDDDEPLRGLITLTDHAHMCQLRQYYTPYTSSLIACQGYKNNAPRTHQHSYD